MVEILKEGNKRFRASCGVCGCIFEYSIDDTMKKFGAIVIECPCCDEEIHHNVLRAVKSDIEEQEND